MNTRDEIIDAMEGRRSELPPPAVFTSTATVSQMDSSGCSWPEANFDPQKMVGLSLEMHRRFGFASVRLPFSICVEAKVHGCELGEGKKDTPPSIMSSPYAGKGALQEELQRSGGSRSGLYARRYGGNDGSGFLGRAYGGPGRAAGDAGGDRTDQRGRRGD